MLLRPFRFNYAEDVVHRKNLKVPQSQVFLNEVKNRRWGKFNVKSRAGLALAQNLVLAANMRNEH